VGWGGGAFGEVEYAGNETARVRSLDQRMFLAADSSGVVWSSQNNVSSNQ